MKRHSSQSIHFLCKSNYHDWRKIRVIDSNPANKRISERTYVSSLGCNEIGYVIPVLAARIRRCINCVEVFMVLQPTQVSIVACRRSFEMKSICYFFKKEKRIKSVSSRVQQWRSTYVL